ncbi:MAG: hypothetical protein WD768_20355 [Phycisphaeraceae bacterium]
MQPSPQDTGLDCPWCGYNLTAITTNRCPECGKRFVLAKPRVREVTKHRSFHLAVEVSMICPGCGEPAGGFMPRQCTRCGRRFTLRERLFGTRRAEGDDDAPPPTTPVPPTGS